MPERYWFPAKRRGWGWGPPCAWQGWAVFVGYIVVVVAIPCIVSPAHEPIPFAVAVAGVTLALLLVCVLKGEPPRWRWP